MKTKAIIPLFLVTVLAIVNLFTTFIPKYGGYTGLFPQVNPEIFLSNKIIDPYTSLQNLIYLHNFEKKFDITEAEIYDFIRQYSDDLNKKQSNRLSRLILAECENYNIDPLLVLAVIGVESEFAPKAVSGKGAIGLMQIMPDTGSYVANRLGIDFQGVESLFDPQINVKLGIYYLSMLEQQFDDIEHALIAYNYGPQKFSELKSKFMDKKPNYLKKVLAFKDELIGKKLLTKRG